MKSTSIICSMLSCMFPYSPLSVNWRFSFSWEVTLFLNLNNWHYWYKSWSRPCVPHVRPVSHFLVLRRARMPLRVIKAEFGALWPINSWAAIQPYNDKSICRYWLRRYCPPVAHVRPVRRFLIPSGAEIPLAVRNVCLGRIWRGFHFAF